MVADWIRMKLVTVMNSVMTGGIEDVFQWTYFTDDVSMKPKLIDQV